MSVDEQVFRLTLQLTPVTKSTLGLSSKTNPNHLSIQYTHPTLTRQLNLTSFKSQFYLKNVYPTAATIYVTPCWCEELIDFNLRETLRIFAPQLYAFTP